jgi:hypothetical protein
MKNKFFLLFFLAIFLIAFSVLAEEIGTTTELEIGTTTELEIGTTTEPEIGTTTEPETFEPTFFNIGLEPSILGNGGTIFEDDFNSYDDGNLITQGGWADIINGSFFQIQGSVVKEGAKAVSIAGGDSYRYVKKVGTLKADGKITFYFLRTAGAAAEIQFNFMEGAADAVWLMMTGNSVEVMNGNSFFSAGSYTDDIWNYVEIEWRSSDHYLRYKVNGGTWTDWYPHHPSYGWTNGLDTVKLGSNINTTGMSYFDYIAENPYEEAPPVPPSGEFNSTNTFFAYFFGFGDYLLPIFGFVLVVVLVAGILNFILTLDKKKSIN